MLYMFLYVSKRFFDILLDFASISFFLFLLEESGFLLEDFDLLLDDFGVLRNFSINSSSCFRTSSRCLVRALLMDTYC